MSMLRKVKRQMQRNSGILPLKKAMAHRTGRTLAEVNKKWFNKKKD